MKKAFLCIGIIIIVIVLLYIIYDKIIFDDTKLIATMYYSYMDGPDAGTEYIVSLYTSNDNCYKYKITTDTITESGPIFKRISGIGTIKTEDDLINLDIYFKNKKENGTELYGWFSDKGTYSYINSPNNTLNFEELMEVLF